ncbi:MAG: VPLPA-CTERM sorting domain-containing protein [Nitrospira sp.]|nr:VPLPA-CTERM sorting domain-containing protein [Nitrospira sp.]
MQKGLLILSAVLCGATILPGGTMAASIYTVNTSTTDAFLANGSATNPVCTTNCANLNFGGAGTLAIAPASSPKGQFDSVVQWNTAGAATQFNTAFGAGNWHITNVSLNLASNFGDQGEQPNNGIFNTINAGQFNVKWISNDSWIEGTGSGMGTAPGSPPSVTFGNQATTLLTGTSANLGTFTYTPPGDNVYRSYSLALDPNLLSDIQLGSLASLHFTAADDQVGFLFNAKSFAQNHPQFIITADVAPVPVPAAVWLFGSGLAAMVGFARRNGALGSR